MSFAPDITERLARARADLRMGVPIVIRGDSDMLVMAAETLTPVRLAQLQALGGAPVLAITGRRAATLKAHAYDGDLARILMPDDASCNWIRALADPADDLATPLKGPFRSLRDGNVSVHRGAIALMKAARLLPAAVTLDLRADGFAQDHDLTAIPVAALASLVVSPMVAVASAHLPLAVGQSGRLHVFRPEDGAEEHYAIEIGQADRMIPVLTRLHSACFTGDLLGSLKCDCGPQLRGAMAQMADAGQGVLLYLNQEGRGIGLANKMRAYALQDQGFDTVEANHRLGFEDDERDFRIGAEILKQLGFARVRLLTNNPAKMVKLEDCGIEVVERVSLRAGANPHNHAYLATKAAKSGHDL